MVEKEVLPTADDPRWVVNDGAQKGPPLTGIEAEGTWFIKFRDGTRLSHRSPTSLYWNHSYRYPDADIVAYIPPAPLVLCEQIEDTEEGVKFDNEKPRYDLIPPEMLHQVAEILTFGAAKYGSRNWEKGMCWGRVFAALMRHMWAWWRGENTDPETGKSHLAHAACCIAFLMAYETRQVGEDDRP